MRPIKNDESNSLFVPTIRNLKAARSLAPDDNIAVLRTQFDLADMAAGDVNFLGDQGRALRAAASLAARDVLAPMDANGRRCWVEVRLKHVLSLQNITRGLWILDQCETIQSLRIQNDDLRLCRIVEHEEIGNMSHVADGVGTVLIRG